MDDFTDAELALLGDLLRKERAASWKGATAFHRKVDALLAKIGKEQTYRADLAQAKAEEKADG